MTETTGDSGPRERRFFVGPRQPGQVALQWTRGEQRIRAAAKLIDLSQGGAKLMVSCCVPMRESVELTVHIPKPDLELSLPGVICWTRASGNDHWNVSCTFTPRLPESVLEGLAALGYLDRRINVRQPVRISALALWEQSGDVCPVEVRDYSRGGFCFFSRRPSVVHQRLRLVVKTEDDDDDVMITAQSRWQAKVQGGYLVGCSFLDGNGLKLLGAYLRSLDGPSCASESSLYASLMETAQSVWQFVRRGTKAKTARRE